MFILKLDLEQEQDSSNYFSINNSTLTKYENRDNLDNNNSKLSFFSQKLNNKKEYSQLENQTDNINLDSYTKSSNKQEKRVNKNSSYSSVLVDIGLISDLESNTIVSESNNTENSKNNSRDSSYTNTGLKVNSKGNKYSPTSISKNIFIDLNDDVPMLNPNYNPDESNEAHGHSHDHASHSHEHGHSHSSSDHGHSHHGGHHEKASSDLDKDDDHCHVSTNNSDLLRNSTIWRKLLTVLVLW